MIVTECVGEGKDDCSETAGGFGESQGASLMVTVEEETTFPPTNLQGKTGSPGLENIQSKACRNAR